MNNIPIFKQELMGQLILFSRMPFNLRTMSDVGHMLGGLINNHLPDRPKEFLLKIDYQPEINTILVSPSNKVTKDFLTEVVTIKPLDIQYGNL